MSELASVMAELEAAGTEQNRKIYRRHGAPEPLFGVSFSFLQTLKKRLKANQALAEQLWATGNTDARTLAVLLTEPKRMTAETLDAWAQDLNYQVLGGYFAKHTAKRSPHAKTLLPSWLTSNRELTVAAAWDLVAILAMDDAALTDEEQSQYLETIEAMIHQAPNWVRNAMNGALIAIGGSNDRLAMRALTAAARIGTVEVDHGETACETPDATAYIQKMRQRKNLPALSL